MSRRERDACVDVFAGRMKAKLAANAHKGDRDGWRCDPPHALLRRLREEVKELADLIDVALVNDDGTDPDFADKVADECADVANFAMFIADVAGGVDVEDPYPGMKPLAFHEAQHSHGGDDEGVPAKAAPTVGAVEPDSASGTDRTDPAPGDGGDSPGPSSSGAA